MHSSECVSPDGGESGTGHDVEPEREFESIAGRIRPAGRTKTAIGAEHAASHTSGQSEGVCASPRSRVAECGASCDCS
eukprot:5728642-Pleurochrysis_carterae.AAC.1